ncbi:MAG: anti-sigma factor [Steroidobacteraceae bacterium]
MIERLAAEYVLGTLRGAARARFERLRARQPGIAAQVRDWEDRLYSLTASVRAVAPSAAVWPRIALRVGLGGAFGQPAPAARRRPATLRWLALAASVAMLAIGLLLLRSPEEASQREWRAVAQVAAASGETLWAFEYDARAGILRARAVAASDAPGAKALELWALPTVEGGAPVSLGLLPRSGTTDLRLDTRQLAALRVAQQIAVSLEPPGGSPTGLPTGPVLHVAPVDIAQRG